MRNRLFVCFAVGAVSIAIPSCTLTTSSPPDQTITDFCADWAKAICQIGNGACTFDVPTCTTYQVGFCTSFVSMQQGGTRVYSQANGSACIQALGDIYGGNPSAIQVMPLLNVSTICGRVVSGNQPTDQSCNANSDCATGLVCAPTVLGGTTEVCAPIATKQLGDICGDPGDECQGNSYCESQGSGQAPLCVMTPVVGSACSAAVPCGAADTCSPLSNTCIPSGVIGSPCTPGANDECASGYCDPYASECTNGLTFALGSTDCKGIEGTGGGTMTPAAEAGTEPDAGASSDANTAGGG